MANHHEKQKVNVKYFYFYDSIQYNRPLLNIFRYKGNEIITHLFYIMLHKTEFYSRTDKDQNAPIQNRKY